MSQTATPTVVAFLAGLTGVFGASFAVGSAIGPVGDPAPAHAGGHQAADDSPPGALPAVSTPEIPGGLMVSQGGYTLDLHADTAQPGRDRLVEFHVAGPDGEPVTEYEVDHGKQLHLIVVRRDFTGFQHTHPQRDAQGTWTAQIDLGPGQWRIFADFTPVGGDSLTLGADLLVAGRLDTAPEPAGIRTAHVDGYTVTLVGALLARTEAELTLRVSKDGRPVTDLQPYLGAYGHLVALREGDLAYLHVHPDGAPGDGRTEAGPEVGFVAAVPSPGEYRLYLDFKHDGVVRTAAFALGTGNTDEAAPPTPRNDPDDEAVEHENSEHGH